MSNYANKCPKCQSYILGEYCYICNIDIRNYLINNKEIPDFLKDIFGDKNDKIN